MMRLPFVSAASMHRVSERQPTRVSLVVLVHVFVGVTPSFFVVALIAHVMFPVFRFVWMHGSLCRFGLRPHVDFA